MKEKLFSFLIVFLCAFSMSLQAQSFKKLWNEVKSMRKLDRPKSALSLTESIYQKALKERNLAEMLKAYMYGMEFREQVTPDSVARDIEKLEVWTSETTEPLDAALLRSVLAEQYANYARHSVSFTPLMETVFAEAEDMEQWSGNIFVQKAFENAFLSLKDKELLANTSVDAFKPIVEKGWTSEYFYNDMFHLLGDRAVSVLHSIKWEAERYYNQTDINELLPTEDFLKKVIVPASDYDCSAGIMRIYQSMLRYYLAVGNLKAAVLVDLERLPDSYGENQKEYYDILTSMTTRYASVDVCAEVYKKMAEIKYIGEQNPSAALSVLEQATRRYPSYTRINALRQLEAQIKEPSLMVKTQTTAYPGKKLQLEVNYRNLSGATLKIYRLNLPVTSDLLVRRDKASMYSKYAKLAVTVPFKLKPTQDYMQADTTLAVEGLAEGIWLLEVIPDAKVKQKESRVLYVTKLKTFNRVLPDNRQEFVVVDSETGFPESGASVLLYQQQGGGRQEVLRLVTDERGAVKASSGQLYNIFRAEKEGDVYMPFIDSYAYRYRNTENNVSDRQLKLFTDRSIYRPGQTVYVSGIAYEIKGDKASVLSKSEYTLTLYDANYKELANKKIQTNEFGSFAGEFTLPFACLPGRFSLEAGAARIWFQVDEYKRPSFEVTLLPIMESYVAGDSVTVKGVAKSFTGVPLQNVEVNYTVNTQMAFRLTGAKNEFAGTTRTDDKGCFSFRVFLRPLDNGRIEPLHYYSYKVEAAVTGGAGETQSGILNIPLGSSSLKLWTDMPANIEKSAKDSITVFVRNLGGEPENVSGTMKVFKLASENKERPEVTGKAVWQGSFVSNKAFRPSSVLGLPTGYYRIVWTVKDKQGKEVKQQNDFVLYSVNETKPPYSVTDWLQVVKSEFSPESPAMLLFGTSEKDVYVMYDVFAGGKHLESKQMMLTDSVMRMEYPYMDKYGDGLFVQFTFVKKGTLYEKSAQITRALPDKKLTLKWETFRDKLRPGQKEEWKLRIFRPDGKPADAELLAMMYDASLDKLSARNWSFNLFNPRTVQTIWWNSGYPSSAVLAFEFLVKQWKYRPLEYDHLTLGPSSKASSDTAMGFESVVTGIPLESRVFAARMSKADSNVAEEGSAPEVQVRKNFSETAFFYPQLRTNAEGEVSFSFMLPESLTEWKFLGFSHTKDMDWGITEAVAVASKDFMVAPNLPRFIRVGDVVSIAANVINLTGKDLSGMAKLQLFNPETEKNVVVLQQPFAVKAGQTGVVNFSFEVKENFPQLPACRIVAEGENFSDGEQQLIPVLSNQQQITESVPMAVEGKTTKVFSLESLFNNQRKSATGRRLIVEFTSNPAWYAVQALPSLSNPSNDNAIAWASAYYANSVASYIANSNPRIKVVFDLWKQQGGTKETLLSNLQKNQELKNILLEETPWVMEAQNETEQKQRIATLFDLNTIQNNNTVAIDKLKALQHNGAWSWYKGMYPSEYVTLFVAEVLARVHMFTGKALPQDAKALQDATWEYLHKEALKEYKNVVTDNKEDRNTSVLSSFMLKYLYLSALTEQKFPESNKAVQAYFTDKIVRTLDRQDLYQKALSAVILFKAGKKTDAVNFIISMKEYAVQSPGMGMYYDSKAAPYLAGSYRIPTQVAVMEAMQLAGEMNVVEQMKIWLLRQKQTQAWDSPVSTVNAVYALLDRGTNLLVGEGEVKITLGKKIIENPLGNNASPGLGYVKETFVGNEIKPDMKAITVKKESEGIAWGAVYAQYMEDITLLKSQSAGLAVEKSLYVERIVNHRLSLIPLKQVQNLTVGDKVVSRITVKADRDMEFVQLKDQCAACMEPVSSLSGYRMVGNAGGYVAVKDASTEIFFDSLRKGTYVLELSYYLTREGDYSAGIAFIQSAYAPEFSAHSASEAVKVVK